MSPFALSIDGWAKGAGFFPVARAEPSPEKLLDRPEIAPTITCSLFPDFTQAAC